MKTRSTEWTKGFYKHTLKISVFIFSTNIWIFFQSFLSLWVFLKNWAGLFFLPISILEWKKWMSLCTVWVFNENLFYLAKNLYYLVKWQKLRGISGRRSAYKVYIFLALFWWYLKNPEAENGVEPENWNYWRVRNVTW